MTDCAIGNSIDLARKNRMLFVDHICKGVGTTFLGRYDWLRYSTKWRAINKFA